MENLLLLLQLTLQNWSWCAARMPSPYETNTQLLTQIDGTNWLVNWNPSSQRGGRTSGKDDVKMEWNCLHGTCGEVEDWFTRNSLFSMVCLKILPTKMNEKNLESEKIVLIFRHFVFYFISSIWNIDVQVALAHFLICVCVCMLLQWYFRLHAWLCCYVLFISFCIIFLIRTSQEFSGVV